MHARTYTHTHIKYTKAYTDLITRYTLQAGNLSQRLHNQFNLIAITLTMSATLGFSKLEDTVVTVDSVTAFSSAVGRALQGAAPPHIGSQSRNAF